MARSVVCPSVCLSSVTKCTVSKRTSWGVGDGTLAKAGSYRLSIVTKSLSAAVWLQFPMEM